MRMMTSCELITFSPDAHEVGSAPAETKRKIKCQEMVSELKNKKEPAI